MAAAIEPRLEENTVKYSLYPVVKPKDGLKVTSFLEDYISEAYGRLGKHLTPYIWQKEPFRLRVAPDSPTSGPHVEGCTDFGDNVEDEWFIVYLLRQLTQRDTDLVVKVEDADGEFLLIEAADHLPEWADPETSANRVFIYRSELHLVPLNEGPLPEGVPRVEDAVRVIRRHSSLTRCSDKIQGLIKKRISGYPAKIRGDQHNAKCFLPAAVAALLKQDPNLMSSAVRAFYTRDPIDMRACRVMKYFPPENRVLTMVTFTRCLFAQLMGQKYVPDHKIGWNMPPPHSPLFKSYDLGMKIASGFEILATSSSPSSGTPAAEGDLDLESDARWQQFCDSLKKNGYFEGLLKGSRGYNQLEAKAKMFYKNSVPTQEDAFDTHSSKSVVGQRLINLLKSTEIDYEKLKKEEAKLGKDDDETWMEMTPDDLDALLKQRFLNQDEDFSQLASSIPEAMRSFVEYEAGFEGAEVPPVRPKRSKGRKSRGRSIGKSNDKPAEKIAPKNERISEQINFDADNFGDALSSILSLKVPQTDSDASSSSGMSDYDDSEEDTVNSCDDSCDEDELNLMVNNKAKNSAKQSRKGKAGVLVMGMKGYMDQMDKELAATEVGKSFEREGSGRRPPLATGEEDIDEEEDYRPVDVDLTAIKNILESYSSQAGSAGPSGNILSSMGVFLPKNSDNFTNGSK